MKKKTEEDVLRVKFMQVQVSQATASFTERGYDDAQGDQRLVDVGALRQPIPTVVGICSFTAGHSTIT